MTVQEAAEICLQFRKDRNSEECICQYLSKVLDVMETKKSESDLPVNYQPTNTRKIWRF